MLEGEHLWSNGQVYEVIKPSILNSYFVRSKTDPLKGGEILVYAHCRIINRELIRFFHRQQGDSTGNWIELLDGETLHNMVDLCGEVERQ